MRPSPIDARRTPAWRRGPLLLWGVAAAQALVLGLAALPANRATLWGWSPWTFLPPGAIVLCAAAGIGAALILLAAPPFPSRWMTWLLAGALAAPLFYIFRDRSHLLGDGRLWLSVLVEDRVYHPHEPLAFGAALLATAGAHSNFATAGRAMELLSVGLGGAAVALSLALACRLSSERAGRWLAAGLLLGGGTIQFAFGYVEAYPVLWVAVLLFLVVAFDVLHGRAPLWAAGLTAGLAAAVHSHAFLLAPAVAFLFARRARSVNGAILAGLVALVPVAAAYALLPLGLRPGATPAGGLDLVVHRWGRLLSDLQLYPYGVLPWAATQLNTWGLAAGGAAAGLLLAAPVALRIRGHAESSGRDARLFLGLAAAGLALPILLFNLEWSRGASADWDAFAVAQAPLAALAALLWGPVAQLARKGRRQLAALLGPAVFAAAAFVAVNASTGPSERRFEMLADATMRTPRARSWACETLALLRRERGDMSGAADFYARSVQWQPANERLLRNAAGAFQRAGRSRDAIAALRRITALKPDDAETWLHLGMELDSAGAVPDSAVAACRQAVTLKPQWVDALNVLARLLLRTPDTRPEAWRLLSRSLELAPGQPHAAELAQTKARLEADGYGRER